MNKNPWLKIPLSDYEAHMALPSVQQSQFLADIFKQVLKSYNPVSVAIIGCSGGNGLDQIDCAITKHVVGIDINEDYINTAKTRYGNKFNNAEFITKDIQKENNIFNPVDLIYAALIFEYVNPDIVLNKLRNLLINNGILVSVVQLSSHLPKISETPFQSLNLLSEIMAIVNTEEFKNKALKNKFEVIKERTEKLTTGKCFKVLEFKAK